MQKNILITGALGYLGQTVLRKLQRDLQTNKINSLVAMDIKLPTPDQKLDGVTYLQTDIRDKTLLVEQLKEHQVTHVIHLAAILDSQSTPREFQYQVDVQGTQNILEACLAAKTQRIIISSSGAAYGYHADNPDWLTENDTPRGNEIFAYSDHKRLVEEMLAKYRKNHPELEQTIFRVCTILGATTDNLITNLFDKKRILGIRGHLSPYVFVWDEDVAACMHQAIYSEQTGVYNLAGDGAITNRDLAKILGKTYLELSAGLLRTGLAIGNKLKLTQYGPDQLLFIQYRPVLDNQKLKKVFGYEPQKTSLETFLFYLNAKQKPHYNLDKIEILIPS